MGRLLGWGWLGGVGLVALLVASQRQGHGAAVLVAASPSKAAQQSIWQYLDIPAASSGDHASPHWGYAKGEDWSAEFDKWEECSSGEQQSPINVQRSYWSAFWGSAWAKRYLKSKRADTGPLGWHVAATANAKRHDGFTFHKAVTFDGHTIEVPYKHPHGAKGGLVEVTGPDGHAYELEMMRVHTPSEHTFDGKAYAMEVQFEHARFVHGKKAHLVVSLFLHEGDTSPEFVTRLAAAARRAKSQEAEDESTGEWGGVEGLEVEEVPFTEIAQAVLMQTEMPLEIHHHITHDDNSPHPIPSYSGRALYEDEDASQPNYKAYYYYHGSSTRPPCGQVFSWVLLKHSMSVTTEDLRHLTKLTGANARKTQKLNGRLVMDSNPF
jgi:carbonic anhydrase